MVIVGKYPEGITLNPLEYLLDIDGDAQLFPNEESARAFLIHQGFTPDYIECLVFETYEE